MFYLSYMLFGSFRIAERLSDDFKTSDILKMTFLADLKK